MVGSQNSFNHFAKKFSLTKANQDLISTSESYSQDDPTVVHASMHILITFRGEHNNEKISF